MTANFRWGRQVGGIVMLECVTAADILNWLLRVPATAVRGHPGWSVRDRGGG